MRIPTPQSSPWSILAALVVSSLVAVCGAATSGAARGAATASAAPAGLVAAYSFDAASGSTLADASGNGNNGVISGAVWSVGKTAAPSSSTASTIGSPWRTPPPST